MWTKQRGKSSPVFLCFEYQALFIYHLAKFARFAKTYSDLVDSPVKHKIFAKSLKICANSELYVLQGQGHN